MQTSTRPLTTARLKHPTDTAPRPEAPATMTWQISTCGSQQAAMTCSPFSSAVQLTRGSDLDSSIKPSTSFGETSPPLPLDLASERKLFGDFAKKLWCDTSATDSH